MATYELPISSPLTESGDDVYCKPTDSDFAGGGTWVTSIVAATEVEDTNVYLATLDETKGYLAYLNGSFNSFTANAGTDVFTDNSHGLVNGDALRFKGTDLPAPLEQSTIYYVRDATTNTFKVAATAGGAAIDITDVGSGTMVYVAPSQRSKAADVFLGTVPVRAIPDMVGEAEISEILAQLDVIQAKTDLIGTGNATTTAPVTLSGTIPFLVRGDDYMSESTAIKTTVSAPGDAGSAASCSAVFAGYSEAHKTGWKITGGTVTDLGGGQWELKSFMPSSATIPCKPGCKYEWTHTLVDASGEIRTQKNGVTKLIDGYAVARYEE